MSRVLTKITYHYRDKHYVCQYVNARNVIHTILYEWRTLCTYLHKYIHVYEEHKSLMRVYSRCVCGYTHSVIAESVFRRLTDLGKQWTFDCSRFSAGLLPSNPNSRYRVAQWRGCVSICIHKLREMFPIFRQVQFQTRLDFIKSCSWLLPIMNTVDPDARRHREQQRSDLYLWGKKKLIH